MKFLACLEVRIRECGPQFALYHQIEVRIGECGPQSVIIVQIEVCIRECGPQFEHINFSSIVCLTEYGM